MTVNWVTSLYLLLFGSFQSCGVSYSVCGSKNGRAYTDFGCIDGGKQKPLADWVVEIKEKVGDTGKLVRVSPRWS